MSVKLFFIKEGFYCHMQPDSVQDVPVDSGDLITNLVMLGILLTVILIYFLNNPLKHAKDFRIRCFLNWFPLGLTYAFLYMGRYNLTVAKSSLGDLIPNQSFGDIFGLGSVVYGCAFLLNGPITEKIGGKKAILIGTAGSLVMNVLMGVCLYGVLNGLLNPDALVISFMVLYAVNMYFQSFGAVAVVKINSHWFNIKERGVLGGIFGTLISLGLFYAFNWGDLIVEATKAKPDASIGLIEGALRSLLNVNGNIDQIWYVFFIPAFILVIFFFIILFFIKDSPEEAGFSNFELGDASESDHKDDLEGLALIKKLIANPIILTIACIEFCSGVLRQSVMHWYKIFVEDFGSLPGNVEAFQPAQFFCDNWGLLLCFAGILGGMFAGFISDKLFGSRRGPSAVFLYAVMLISAAVMAFTLKGNQFLVGCIVVLMSLCVIGVHGMLSGTATMDFGGKKAAATTTGLVDGFVYLGTGFQAFALGRLTTIDWGWWPVFMIPFACIGLYFSLKIWKAFPGTSK